MTCAETLKSILDTILGGRPKPPKPPKPPDPIPPGPTTPLNEKMLALINSERQKAGSSPLSDVAMLSTAAQKHSNWMATYHKLDHNEGSITFTQRIQNEGYRWSAAGENIGYGYTSAEAVVNGWMKSPGHKANILNPKFTDVGFGMSNNYWTADFAAPARLAGISTELDIQLSSISVTKNPDN